MHYIEKMSLHMSSEQLKLYHETTSWSKPWQLWLANKHEHTHTHDDVPLLIGASVLFVPQCVSVSLPVVGACVPRSAVVPAAVFAGPLIVPYWPAAAVGNHASE